MQNEVLRQSLYEEQDTPVAVDEKVIVIVAPNGARRTQKNHQHLPLTAREVAEDTLLNSQVGATMVHAHARKMDASHSLEIDDNHRLYAAIRETVGDKVVVQLTTEAVGIYPVEQQMAMIKAVQPEAASFGLRELIQPDSDLEQVRDFFHWVAQQGIIAQYILYSAEEVIRYHQLKEMAILPPDRHHLLFVLGRYTEGQYSAPRDLFPFIVEHKDDTPWAMCAFGRDEHRCVSAALSLGGDVRVGFENNLYNMRGHIAYNNAVLVKQVVDTASSMGREIMSAAEFRQLLT